MKSREDMLRDSVRKLRPEASMREKVLAGGQGRRARRPAVRRMALAGAFCMVLLACAALIPGILRGMEPAVAGPATAGASSPEDAPSLTAEEGGSLSLAALADESGQVDLLLILQADGQGQTLRAAQVLPECQAELPDGETGPLAAAYAAGGLDGLQQTVEQFLDLRFEGTAVVTAQAAAAFVDELGGVEVTLTEEEGGLLATRSDNVARGLAFASGMVRLSGEEALYYMELEAGGTGDAARKTAVLQAVWQAMAASPQDSAQAAASLLNRADSSLPQASAAEMAQLLAYSLETAVLPLSSGYEQQENGLLWTDQEGLRAEAKEFFLTQSMEAALSSVHLPPYQISGKDPFLGAVESAFLAGWDDPHTGTVRVPGVFVYDVRSGASEADSTLVVTAAAIGMEFSLKESLLEAERGMVSAAVLRLAPEGEGYRLLSIDMADFRKDLYTELYRICQDMPEVAEIVYSDLDGFVFQTQLWQAVDENLSLYVEENQLSQQVTGYRLAGKEIPFSQEPPFLDAFPLAPEMVAAVSAEVESGSETFVREEAVITPLVDAFAADTYQYIGRFPQIFLEGGSGLMRFYDSQDQLLCTIELFDGNLMCVDGLYYYSFEAGFVTSSPAMELFGQVLADEYYSSRPG